LVPTFLDAAALFPFGLWFLYKLEELFGENLPTPPHYRQDAQGNVVRETSD